MNEWTPFFIKIYLSHFILKRVDVGCAWVVSWRWGQTATYWSKVLLTIAALLLHSGWAAQPWVTEGCKPSVCKLILMLASYLQLNCNWPKPSLAPGYIIVSHPPASCGHTHLPPSPNSTMSTGQGDIPISSTRSTCFVVFLLIYTGTSLGRGSIYNRKTLIHLLSLPAVGN